MQGPKGKSDVDEVKGCVVMHSNTLVKEKRLNKKHKSAKLKAISVEWRLDLDEDAEQS